MRKLAVFGVCGIAVLASGAYADHAIHQSRAQTQIGVVDPDNVTLKPAPIQAGWVLEGRPKTEAAEIAATGDGSTKVYVWRTTASRFNWFYDSDEIITVLDGEVFVADEGKPERRLGPGDVAFFPTGARTVWRVPDHVRKIATLKRPLPTPFASVMRWMKTAKDWVKPSSAFAADWSLVGLSRV